MRAARRPRAARHLGNLAVDAERQCDQIEQGFADPLAQSRIVRALVGGDHEIQIASEMPNRRQRRIERSDDEVVGIRDALQQARPRDAQPDKRRVVLGAALERFRIGVEGDLARGRRVLPAALGDRYARLAAQDAEDKIAARVRRRMPCRSRIALERAVAFEDSDDRRSARARRATRTAGRQVGIFPRRRSARCRCRARAKSAPDRRAPPEADRTRRRAFSSGQRFRSALPRTRDKAESVGCRISTMDPRRPDIRICDGECA